MRVDFNKKTFIALAILCIVLMIVGFGYAIWNPSKTLFHDADDVKISIDSTDYSLQEAIDSDLIKTNNLFDAGLAPVTRSYETIRFNQKFSEVPVTFITPHWFIGGNKAISARIIEKFTDGVTISTGGLETDGMFYFAIPKGTHTIDGRKVEVGVVDSPSANFEVTFPSSFSKTPVVILTVDESLTDDGARSCRVYQADNIHFKANCWNYDEARVADRLNWIALEPTGNKPIHVGGYTIQAEMASSSAYTEEISFKNGFFTPPSAILVTPYDTNNNGATQVRINKYVKGGSFTHLSWAGDAVNSEYVNYIAVESKTLQ